MLLNHDKACEVLRETCDKYIAHTESEQNELLKRLNPLSLRTSINPEWIFAELCSDSGATLIKEKSIATQLYDQLEKIKQEKRIKPLYAALLGYIKRQAVLELLSCLNKQGISAKEKLQQCDELINPYSTKMLKILDTNRQSRWEFAFKVLSVIGIFVGIGIFTTAILFFRHWQQTGGKSFNFFAPVTKNIANDFRQIQSNQFKRLSADILIYILQFTDKKTVVEMREISKEIKKIIDTHQLVNKTPYAVLDYTRLPIQKIFEFPIKMHDPNGMLFLGKNVAVMSSSTMIHIYNFTSKKLLFNLEHDDLVKDSLLLIDRRVASIANKTIYIWNIVNKVCDKKIQHDVEITAFAALPNGNFVSSDKEGNLHVWDEKTGHCIFSQLIHTDASTYSPIQKIFVISAEEVVSVVQGLQDTSNSKIYITNFTNPSKNKVLSYHASTTKHVQISPRFIAQAKTDNTIHLYDRILNNNHHILTGHMHNVTNIVFLPDQNLMISVSLDKTLKVWNTNTFECEKILEGFDDVVNCMVRLGENLIVTAERNFTFRIWDLTIGKCVNVLNDFTPNHIYNLSDGNITASFFTSSKRNITIKKLEFPDKGAQFKSLPVLRP